MAVKGKHVVFLVVCLLLTRTQFAEGLRAGKHDYHNNDVFAHSFQKKNRIHHYVHTGHVIGGDNHVQGNPRHLISKKAEIEGAIKDIESHEHKDKRGFLSNLANLLNDAEAISGHKTIESGLSSVPSVDKVTNSETKKSTDTLKSVDIPKSADVSKKEEIIPSSEDIQKALNDTTKDFAPIFAMFHGKIIPLGKLPDSAFKKSRTELPPEWHQIPEKHSEVKEDKDSESDAQKVTKTAINEKQLKSEVAKLSKLQKYLTNLDGHITATGATKDVRGSVKDQVMFPEEETGTTKSEILNHVKGVVLDNGKIVSVNNHVDNQEETVKQIDTSVPESQQKFIVTDDGSLTPVTKAKPEIGEAVTRDITGGSDGQKTVALSLDVLKDLLKKTDNKISLAALLNKSGETKSETPPEEEDPGTIEDFAAGGLKAHNQYRAQHHDDSLIWSDDLAAKAQKLAESLADKKTLQIAKDLEKEGFGENVAKVWATFKNAGEAATKMWYSQSENYHFDDPHLDENTGQFAQLIWKNTRELGMGVAKSIDDVNNKYVYVTALYKPPGNIEATLRENVLPTGNNTVDVYTTFFKRAGVVDTLKNMKRSRLQHKPKKILNIVDEKD